MHQGTSVVCERYEKQIPLLINRGGMVLVTLTGKSSHPLLLEAMRWRRVVWVVYDQISIWERRDIPLDDSHSGISANTSVSTVPFSNTNLNH